MANAKRSNNDNDNEDQFRASLISFHGDVVEISTWWIDKGKYALLRAALGTPEVDSLYDRTAFNSSDKTYPEGAHFIPVKDK